MKNGKCQPQTTLTTYYILIITRAILYLIAQRAIATAQACENHRCNFRKKDFYGLVLLCFLLSVDTVTKILAVTDTVTKTCSHTEWFWAFTQPHWKRTTMIAGL